MKKWQRTVETIAEELDWSFSLNDNGKKICLQIYSPAGQDCNLEIDASSFNEYRQKVEEYYEDYDPELEGKAVKYDGSFPDGKYPNFRSIRPTDFKKTHTANEFDFEKFDEFVRDAKSQIKLKVHKDMYNFYVCIGGCYFRLELLIKLVAYMKKIGTTTLWTNLMKRERVPNSWEHFTDEDGNPVEKITEFVPKMCYVESADGASWGVLMPMMEAGKGPNDVVLSL